MDKNSSFQNLDLKELHNTNGGNAADCRVTVMCCVEGGGSSKPKASGGGSSSGGSNATRGGCDPRCSYAR